MTNTERRFLHAVREGNIKKITTLRKKVKDKHKIYYQAVEYAIQNNNATLLYYFLILINIPFSHHFYDILRECKNRVVVEIFYYFNSKSVHDDIWQQRPISYFGKWTDSNSSLLLGIMKSYEMEAIDRITQLRNRFFAVLPKTPKNVLFSFK